MVVLEASLGHVERRVLLRVVMMRSIPGALEQRPDAFYRVGVDRAIDVAFGMLNHAVIHDPPHHVVGPVFVRDQRRGVRIDSALDKGENALPPG